jgi:SAM-dependent methyltransferase
MTPLKPSPLLVRYACLFTAEPCPGPVLDLACGHGHHGVFLAERGLEVTCCDRSADALDRARGVAAERGVRVHLWQVDLEQPGINPLPQEAYGGILVFRYLHRPLMPCIRKALRPRGVLIYETFTVEQPRFGRPRNPDFLLRSGELHHGFTDWEIIHSFEGLLEGPTRAVAQIVCRKPPIEPVDRVERNAFHEKANVSGGGCPRDRGPKTKTRRHRGAGTEGVSPCHPLTASHPRGLSPPANRNRVIGKDYC